MKSFVSQLLNIPAKRDNVMFFSGSGSMVQPFLLLFATLLTLRDRALDTIHEALTISGGSCLGMHSSRIIHVVSNIVYKYIMADLVDPSSIMNLVP
jgi:hypothetical protein